MSLLSVVVDELLDVGLGECDLGEDLVGGGGPGERLGGGGPVGNVVADLFDQDFTEVKVPRRIDWRVMMANQVPSGSGSALPRP